MSLRLGFGIGIPMGYPEGGGTNPQDYYIISEIGEFMNAEEGTDVLMVTEVSP